MSAERLHDLVERLAAVVRNEVRLSDSAGKRLQPVHLAALAYLQACNRFSDTPQAVTEFLGLTKGTVSQSIRALESGGYINKVPDANDGRMVHLSLTRAGKAALAKLYPSKLLEDSVGVLNAEEQVILEDLLERLLFSAFSSNGQKPFGVCKQCRFHSNKDGGPFCNLLTLPLQETDIDKRCREFEQPKTLQS